MSPSLTSILGLSLLLLIFSSTAQPPPSESPFSPSSPDSPFSPDSPNSPFSPDSPNSPFSPDSPNSPFTPGTPDSPNSPFSPDSPNSPFSLHSPNSPFSPDSPNSPFSPDSPNSPDSPTSGVVDSFDFVNTGPLNNQYLKGEYGSTYRDFQSSSSVLTLAFYNTTPNAYTLALGVDPQNWVWAANPRDPVREGARLSFKEDGNLVLVDFDGRLVWQTNTSNKGVVDISYPIDDQYGDMILHDGNNNVVWQSFDHPSDTLFSNQYFGPTNLVSRASALGGYHSLVMQPNGLSLYYQSSFSRASKPVVYYTLFTTNKTLDRLQFIAYNEFKPSFNEFFTDGTQGRLEVADLTPPSDYQYHLLASFIRLEFDGNLRVHAYQVDFEDDQIWYEPFSLFNQPGESRDHQVDGCLLPERCGAFGVCDNGACMSCPTPKGMVPWTAGKCTPPKLGGRCTPWKNAKYYKVEGVEHFSSKYNEGASMPLRMCKRKCNFDCKCVGYFYHQETSKCWITHDLMTLTKSGNPKHFGFVKTSN